MDPNNIIAKISFNQVLKSPHTYMLMVSVSIALFFVFKFGTSSDLVNDNCEADALKWENAFKEERTKNDNLTQAILFYRGVNYEVKKRTDSLVREKVGNEAIDIVENSKK